MAAFCQTELHLHLRLCFDLDRSRVAGLRSIRAARCALTNLRDLGMVNSPFFLVSWIAVEARSSLRVRRQSCLPFQSLPGRAPTAYESCGRDLLDHPRTAPEKLQTAQNASYSAEFSYRFSLAGRTFRVTPFRRSTSNMNATTCPISTVFAYFEFTKHRAHSGTAPFERSGARGPTQPQAEAVATSPFYVLGAARSSQRVEVVN